MKTQAQDADILDLSLDSFSDADTAEMNVIVGGKPSGWLWTFTGPGHPQTIAQSNRISRDRLHKEKLIEQARVNGRKWVAPEETPEGVRAGNVTFVIERLVGWSAIRIDGTDYPFSEENANKLLSDPKRVGLLAQALEFIANDQAFTKRSV